MAETNVTVVMLTLNEADNIERTLDSAEPAFDELVLVDGDSTDGTVEIARQWCKKHDKDFQVLHSSEREYLLEGPGMQRRRGADMATNDYVMALGADVDVVIHDEEWFQREFKHRAYSHTRVKPSGKVVRDWRLYEVEPEGIDNPARWRGMVHEELQTRDGKHVVRVYDCAEAPMEHHQRRHGAMDVRMVHGEFHHAHDPRAGGNAGKALKKQHYLLKTAMGCEQQRAYLYQDWHKYMYAHEGIIQEHYDEIREKYDLPKMSFTGDGGNSHGAPWWDLDSGEPLMDPEVGSAREYVKKKIPV